MCKTLLMSRFFFCLFTLLTASFLTAQTIPRTDNICFFQDAKTGQPITIVNDSLVYKGELKNPSILKHTDYPEILNRYGYHFIINKHTYLVNVGCGPVLEYRNDSIVRIDNSFLQKNQFGASPFVYKNQICLFGGYGLFTYKNIITRFDFKTMEWLRLFPKNEEEPKATSDNLNFFNSKGLYIIGNHTNTSNNSFEKDSKLWHFDFSTLKWKNLGNYNENNLEIITEQLNKYFPFQTNEKLYLQDRDVILEIDFYNNNIRYYENKNLNTIIPPYFDSKSNSIFYIQFLGGKNYIKLENIPLSELLKHPIKTEKLYYSPWQEYVFTILWITILLQLIFGIYKWVVFQKGKCFVFHQNKNKFYYKTKIISNLDPMEEKILAYLFENKKIFIQLNQLNFFFEKDSPDNFTNVIKKRDLVFSSLVVKLNAIINQEEKSLVLMQKNEADKRIKEIKLNPLYFTLK